MQEMQVARVWSLDQEDPLEKKMVTHSSILAWRIPWAEEPGGLQSMGLKRVGQNLATEHARGCTREEGKGVIHWEIREDHLGRGRVGRRKESVRKVGRCVECSAWARSGGRGWEQVGVLASARLWQPRLWVPYLPNRPCCRFLPSASYPFLHVPLCEKGFGHPLPDSGAQSLSTAYVFSYPA